MRKIQLILLFSFCYFFSVAQIEEGNATYYADKFEGKKTASGELYDSNVFTAAHKTLPFGTEVLVTNKGNGKIVLVTINDRGPFTEGSVIDLSKSAAENIGIIEAGKALVEIQVLKGDMVISTQPISPPAVTPPPSTGGVNIENPEPAPAAKVVTPSAPATTTTKSPAAAPTSTVTAPTAAATSTTSTTQTYLDIPTPIINSKTIKANFAVQLGSFRDLNNLNFQLAKLKTNSFANELNIYETWKGGQKLYKILVGPYPTRKEAESKMRHIKDTYDLQSFVFAVKK